MAEVCRYHKTGYGKSREHCIYMHINQIFEEKTCEVNSCSRDIQKYATSLKIMEDASYGLFVNSYK